LSLIPKIAATALTALAVVSASTAATGAVPAAGAVPVAGSPLAGSPAIGGVSTSGCTAPQGGGPGYSASLGNDQDGKTVCITVGEKLLVVLSAGSPNGPPWRPVHVSKPGILEIVPLTLMLSQGLTATNFEGARAGRVRLTSERSQCTQKSSAARCNLVQLWQATVVVLP
jgi:hypothetical protein